MKSLLTNQKWLLLMLLLTAAMGAWAQNQNANQTVCVGNQPYYVDLIPGATFSWSISTGTSGVDWQINQALPTDRNITVDWNTPGTYILSVYSTLAACPSPAQSVTVTVVPQPVGPTLLALTPNAASVCEGTDVSATFNAGTGGVGCTDAFEYRYDGAGVWTSYTPGDNITTVGHTLVEIQGQRSGCTSGAGCTGTPWVTLASWLVNTNLPVSVSVSESANTVCDGTSVTFTATPTNGGGTPTYQWQVNGGNVGTNSNTYTYVPVNGDVVTVVLTSSETCASGNPATATPITMIVNPNLPVSVSVSESANTVCDGTSVTFTATPTNGGGTPTYQWQVNGGNVGTNSNTYTYVPVNGDVVTVVLTSSETCASGNPATATPITMIVNPNLPVSVSVSESANTVCDGTSVTFTATPTNGGGTPTYQWQVNGGNVGTNSNTFTYVPVNGDVVTVVLTSSETCTSGNPATSAPITMTVNNNLPVSVVVGASANPVCDGTSVTFTATPTNGGGTPTYQWQVNGGNVGTNSNTYTYIPVNGDVVTVVLTSSETCASGNPATATPTTMTINPIPTTSGIWHN